MTTFGDQVEAAWRAYEALSGLRLHPDIAGEKVRVRASNVVLRDRIEKLRKEDEDVPYNPFPSPQFGRGHDSGMDMAYGRVLALLQEDDGQEEITGRAVMTDHLASDSFSEDRLSAEDGIYDTYRD